MAEILGDREIAVTRELTKKYEEFIRGTISEVIGWANEDQIRGEFCLVVEGSNNEEADEEEQWWETLTAKEHVEHYISKGATSKEAIKKAAVDRNVPKREVYDAYHIKQ